MKLLGVALGNGSAQKWPVNLHRTLVELIERAEIAGIELPPLHAKHEWWQRDNESEDTYGATLHA
jgi:hypothetical protein